ncbi:MAG: class I SAM-dependent methyltransferase [Methanosphaera sp.]|nr:class I SAM-dependent methyltransferase [Methanosphaera sp.]
MIHISYDRRKYQEDMIEHIGLLDNVVELGAHVGTSTKIISRLCQDGEVFAFDNSPESRDAFRKLRIDYPNITFRNMDVRDKELLYDFADTCGDISVLCIDLGGGYHPDTVFKVFFLWSSILKPETCLIRNRGLLDFINTALPSENISSTEGYLSSSANSIIPKNRKH